MKKRTVISNTPSRPPVQSTILYTFLLYYFKAGDLYWGIFIAFECIWWLIFFLVKHNEERIDLDDEKSSIKKSKFAERLEQLVRDRK